MNRFFGHLKKICHIAGRMSGAWLLIILQLMSGIASILGLPLLVPVLRMLEDKGASPAEDPILSFLSQGLAIVGLEPSFVLILGLMSLLVVGSIVLDIIVILIGQYRQYNIFSDASLGLLNGYMHVRWPWMVEHHSGEMNHALYHETAQWSNTIFQALTLITTALQTLSYLVVAFYISWKGAAAAGVILMGLFAVNLFLSQQIKGLSSSKNLQQRQYSELVQGVQQNRKFLKSSMLQGPLLVRFKGMVGKLVQYAKDMAWRTQIQRGWAQSGVFMVLVSLLAFHKQLGLGYAELIVLMAAFARLMPQITALSTTYATFASNLPVYEALNVRLENLEVQREVFGDKSYVPGSKIRFVNVGFSYENGQEIMKDVNLEIQPNRTTAIVGGSGQGKSTLLDLLLGLWRPQTGSITYGDIGHDSLDYRSLRARVAYVSQETTLFDGSLYDNLVVGAEKASNDEVRRLLELVQLREMVEGLPDGLETLIGENGICLSGGQRQRVALARALLMKPDLLILDEATSALDISTEAEILEEVFRRLHHKMTILIVTHRTSTVENADMIYSINNGNIELLKPSLERKA